MRFLRRSLTGLALLALTLGLLGLAAGMLRDAARERAERPDGRPPASERVYAVAVDVLTPRRVAPVLTAYGDVLSARELELRAAIGGTLLELAPGLREGGRVRAGEVLYRIDPADADAALAFAENDLAAARAEEAEAAVGSALAREETRAAERQLALRQQALERSEDLGARGVGTAADLEASQLALSSAEQVLTGRRLAQAQAEARVGRAAIARERAAIARDEAVRALEDTVARAPFEGLLTEVTAVPGALVSANERLGRLIDPAALEVAFRVSNAEYARLTEADGGLRPLPVAVSLSVGGVPLDVPGRIDRSGAAAAEGQTGRLVFAALDPGRPGLLRPGDFATVTVTEPELEDVAVVPATAVGPQGRLLVLDADDRLEEVAATVLRRQGDDVILTDVPFGRTYVTERLPQVGPGMRVRPIVPGEQAAAGDVAVETAGMVRLSAERRAGLIAAVHADPALAETDRARLLAALAGEAVPRQMIDRLEARSGGG